MTNYMFGFAYGTRYTKIRIKYNVLIARVKFAISGSYLVPDVPDIALFNLCTSYCVRSWLLIYFLSVVFF